MLDIATLLRLKKAEKQYDQPRPQGLLLDDFPKWRIVGRKPWAMLN